MRNGAGRLASKAWWGQFKGTWCMRCRCRKVTDLRDEDQIQSAQLYLVAAVLRERRADLYCSRAAKQREFRRVGLLL